MQALYVDCMWHDGCACLYVVRKLHAHFNHTVGGKLAEETIVVKLFMTDNDTTPPSIRYSYTLIVRHIAYSSVTNSMVHFSTRPEGQINQYYADSISAYVRRQLWNFFMQRIQSGRDLSDMFTDCTKYMVTTLLVLVCCVDSLCANSTVGASAWSNEIDDLHIHAIATRFQPCSL